MALSDQLLTLSNQAKELEASAEALKDKNDERIDERKAQLRSSLDAARVKLGDQLATAGDQASSDWIDLQTSVSNTFAKIRSDAASRHAQFSAKRAERSAEAAEDDALDAVDFAIYAIQEAEYSILDAVASREEADAKAAE